MTGEAFGPYRLESLLGRGGMGEVWRAVDTSQGDRTVAVKVLGSWLNGDADFAGRFRRESALAARLSGPHIVPIHRYGEIDGRLYIDMPLIEGTDLAALLTAHGPLPPARAVAIIDQVADALDTAQRAGMVHRDVKPSNVLVTARDHVYLIDFGIARALDCTRHSMSGSVIGTLAYMAPERFDGAGDHRGDVYALGCVLHEALTGRPAFQVEGMPAFWKAHSSAPRPRPTALRPDLPSGLDEVVAIAMDPDPDRRHLDAGALAAAAEAALTAANETRVRSAASTVIPERRHNAVPARPPASQHTPRVESSVRQPMTSMPFPAAPGPRKRAAGSTAWIPPDPIAELVLTGRVTAVTIAQLGGRAVVISAESDGTLRVWDLTTGEPVGSLIDGYPDRAIAVATAQLYDRPVVVSGHSDNTIRVWDLTTGKPIGSPHTSHPDGLSALTATTLDDRSIIISGGKFERTPSRPTSAAARVREWWRPTPPMEFDFEVRVWDLATGEPVGRLSDAYGLFLPHRVRALTTTMLVGRTVVVGLNDLVVWDLVTKELIGIPCRPPVTDAATIGHLDGRPVIVGSGVELDLRVWDLATGELVGTPTTGHTSRLVAVTTTVIGTRPAIVSASLDGALRVWDLATGEAISGRLIGHASGRITLAATQLDGRPVVVSHGDDGTVRTWDLIARTSG